MIDTAFQDLETGKLVYLQEWDLGEGPDLGEVIDWEGRKLKRLRVEEVNALLGIQCPNIGRIDRPIVSHQLHRWHPDAKAYDASGRPIINNDRDYRELVKKHNGNENAKVELHLDD